MCIRDSPFSVLFRRASPGRDACPESFHLRVFELVVGRVLGNSVVLSVFRSAVLEHEARDLFGRLWRTVFGRLKAGLRSVRGNAHAPAAPNALRTPARGGRRCRRPLLHAGRAATVSDAVEAHGGEATGARSAYDGLDPASRAALLAFLVSL